MFENFKVSNFPSEVHLQEIKFCIITILRFSILLEKDWFLAFINLFCISILDRQLAHIQCLLKHDWLVMNTKNILHFFIEKGVANRNVDKRLSRKHNCVRIFVIFYYFFVNYFQDEILLKARQWNFSKHILSKIIACEKRSEPKYCAQRSTAFIFCITLSVKQDALNWIQTIIQKYILRSPRNTICLVQHGKEIKHVFKVTKHDLLVLWTEMEPTMSQSTDVIKRDRQDEFNLYACKKM